MVGLLTDFFLQMFFFTTVLSIDIRRMEVSLPQTTIMTSLLHLIYFNVAVGLASSKYEAVSWRSATIPDALHGLRLRPVFNSSQLCLKTADRPYRKLQTRKSQHHGAAHQHGRIFAGVVTAALPHASDGVGVRGWVSQGAAVECLGANSILPETSHVVCHSLDHADCLQSWDLSAFSQ